eukprot:6168106-Alexandrium_andersonii.AAC.1
MDISIDGECELAETVAAPRDLDPPCEGGPEVLVSPWPVAIPEDACGCAVRWRLEDWARAQAR